MGPDRVTGIILAGGSSSRLGQTKALVPLGGCSLVEHVVGVLRPLVSELLLVTQREASTSEAESLTPLGLPTTTDIHTGVGTLGGLHAGLDAIRTEYGLVVGCDMPFLNADLLRYMIAQAPGFDVVMPRVGRYYEPLHALYARSCLPTIEQSVLAGRRRIRQALSGLRVRYVEESEIDRYDPEHLSFFNVNTPEELERARSLLAP
jgi:molybdopterin-guanine dinucleotide biosynthesis protein A